MSDSSQESSETPAGVDASKERMLLDAELRGLNAATKGFSQSVKFPEAELQRMRSRRDKLIERSRALRAAVVKSLPSERKIVRPPGLTTTSGSIAIGKWDEDTVQIPSGTVGQIAENANTPDGLVFLGGFMAGGPRSGFATNPGPPASKTSTWLRIWSHQIIFPAPQSTSWLTYGFDIRAWIGIMTGGPGSMVMPIYIGEASHFEGFPLGITATAADVLDVRDLDGTDGQVFSGTSSVERTLRVQANLQPAIKIFVGLSVTLPSDSEIQINDEDFLSIFFLGNELIAQNYSVVRYNYSNELVIRQ